LARAILYVVERRYDAARVELDRFAELAPADAYAHALRGYCLRQMGQSYDAQLAEAKARRLSSGKEFKALFPRTLPMAVPAMPPAQPTSYGGPNQFPDQRPITEPTADPEFERQRQAMRSRLQSRSFPLATYSLIAINVAIYIACALSVGGNFFSPTPTDPNTPFTIQTVGPLYYYGVQIGALMQQDPTQWYRLLTAMFLHANIEHIGLNMLSLFFVGVVTEQLFGRWRFLTIYFVSGILAGLTQYFFSPPNEAALGASGAIFGIFGAFGAFVILRRSLFQRAAGPIIMQWLFWLVLNLVLSATIPGVALYDHIGGMVSGFILGALLIPHTFKVRRLE
jgi:membrane associated rhomboid family serine protease